MSAAVLGAAVLTPGQRYRVELLGRVRTHLALEADGHHRGVGGHRGVGSQPSVQVSARLHWFVGTYMSCLYLVGVYTSAARLWQKS